MQIVLAILVAAALAAQARGPGAAGPVPPKIANFLKRAETKRQGTIADLEFQLRGLRSRGIMNSAVERQIATMEDDLRRLKASGEPFVPPLDFPPQTGDIGRLPRLSCHVDQIWSAQEMLVHCSFPMVVRTVQKYQARGEVVEPKASFLVRGLPTSRFQEGADVELLDVFEVAERKSYRTEDGKSRTVHVLTVFEMSSLEPYLRSKP